jgi:putative lipoprotein
MARCVTAVLCLLWAGQALAGVVTGAVYYLERIALPPDAVLEVLVTEISQADAPAKVLGSTRISPPGQVPIAFEVNYDDSLVQSSHRYAVRATIRVGGALLFSTTQNYPVLPKAGSTYVGRLKVERVAENTLVPGRDVEGTYWKLKTLGEAAITFEGGGREPSLTLHPAGHRATGSGGCNTFTGSYNLKPPALTFASTLSTRRACVNGMETESAYYAALELVRTFSVSGDVLTLSGDKGKTLATFAAVDF